MLGQLNLLAEDSLANLTVLPGSKRARKMTVISGQKCLGSSKKLNPIGLLEKMLLTSSIWSSNVRYLTWKALVTKHGRLYYRLVPSEQYIKGKERSLWPTPLASDGFAWTRVKKTDVLNSMGIVLDRGGSSRVIYYLMALEKSPKEAAQFTEMMMGFPKGWTDLED